MSSIETLKSSLIVISTQATNGDSMMITPSSIVIPGEHVSQSSIERSIPVSASSEIFKHTSKHCWNE
jgi:hypothetical protein